MKPTSKKTMSPEELDLALNALVLQIEGKKSSDSRTEKTQGKKNQQAVSGSSSSVSAPTTPRLTSGKKSTEKTELTFDGSKVNGDPHTAPIKRAKLVRKIEIKKEEVIKRPKKSSDEEKSSSSNTPRAVGFATLDAATPVSNRSAAPTPASTPMPTPRTAGADDVSSSDSSGSVKPRSPRAKELRKKISKGVSKAALNLGKFGEKFASQVSSISTITLATPKSSARNSPKNSSPQKEDVLSFLTIKEKNNIAIVMNQFETGLDASISPVRKKMLLHAKLMELVPDRTKLTNLSVLDALLDDAKKRYSVAFIDQEIDLADPQFVDFVRAGINDAFIKPWVKELATADDAEVKKYLGLVQISFARDFTKSKYEIKNLDGSIKKLTSLDEFIEFIGDGSEGNLPKVVSNIANQNLGIFLKNLLFFRAQEGQITKSILHLDDGTPIRPSTTPTAKYTLSKNQAGKILIDYESNISKEALGDKLLQVQINTGISTFEVVGTTLNIKVRIEVNADGRWHINNPHVVAENWNNVVS